VLIGAVGWLLFQIRENFVYGKAILPWGIFIALAGGAIGLVFAFSAKSCVLEIKKLNKKPEGFSDQGLSGKDSDKGSGSS
jgi:hypothetical protein